MELYIRILPKFKTSTYSKYSFDKMSESEKSKIISFQFKKYNEKGELYKHGGYVECFYGENENRFIVYENVPSFGHILGKFKTMKEATDLIESKEK